MISLWGDAVMAKRKGSLLRQLTLSLGLAIVFLSLASFYYQYQVEKAILLGSIRADLRSQGNLLRAWLGQATNREERQQVARHYIEALEHLERTGQEIIVVDRGGKIVASNTAQKPGDNARAGLISEALATRLCDATTMPP